MVVAIVLCAAGRADAQLVSDPLGVDFFTVDVGTLAMKNVVIRNGGNSAVEVDSVALRNAAAPLSLTAGPELQSLPFVLGATTTATLTVSCMPTAAGTFESEVDLEGLLGAQATHLKIPVHCQGVVPVPPLVVDNQHTNGITFTGSTLVGYEDVQLVQTVGLKLLSTATVPVVITDISTANTDEFRIDASASKLALQPGGTTEFLVYFRPKAKGVRQGTVSVSVRGQAAPVIAVPVQGLGIEPKCQSYYCGDPQGCSLSRRAGASNAALLLLVVVLGRRRWMGRATG